MAETLLTMPNFCQGTHGFHHTLDSALDVLGGMGISSTRITISMAGPGWPSYWVVTQSPAAGAALSADVPVALGIAGTGFFQALPAGMWDSGGELEPGTREIAELFDDPLQKAGNWIRQGARIFDVSRENPQACGRWLNLFGIEPETWPRDKWYVLALLLPSLHRLAGKEEGMRLALSILLGLPLLRIQLGRAYSYMADQDVSRLGAGFSRLGRDYILGERAEDLEYLTLVIGPVSLETYRNFHGEDGHKQLEAVLALCAPCYQGCRVSWVVEHLDRSPRLGSETENAHLGINSRMGIAASAAGCARSETA